MNMEKIASMKDIRKGESIYFNYQGNKAILVRTNDNKLAAYSAICPHEGGGIEWDSGLNKLLCECHLSLFNVEDGSVYRHSSVFELNESLTKIDITVDKNDDIFTV
jgi:nitrite reductase/ring-hydroxylating ferredoxin subunit